MPNPFSDEPIVEESNDVTLDTLVGEGRKYKSADDLAKAYDHADAAIERLKAEKAELEAREKVQRDLLEARLNPNTKPDDSAPPRRQEDTPDAGKPQTETVDVTKLVRDELAAANETQRKANNINNAAEVMNRRFGSAAKAQEAIKARATELGVSFDWLRDVASDSPSAFYASMGITPDDRSSSTPSYSPDVRLKTEQSGVRNYAYYNKLRKENPKIYHSAELRSQMMKDAREQGDKFYNR